MTTHRAHRTETTERQELNMYFDITLRDRFFDTTRHEYVEAASFDEAMDLACDLAGLDLPVDIEVSDGCGSSAHFSINVDLEPVETRVLLLDRQRNTFVEVVVEARTAHDAVAKAIEERLDAEVIAIEAGGVTEWWMDASETELPRPWNFFKPSRRPALRLLAGGAA